MKTLIFAILLLSCTCAFSQSCNPYSEKPKRFFAMVNYNFANGFFGNAAGFGIVTPDEKGTISVNYVEWKRDQPTKSIGLVTTYEVTGDEKFGGAIILGLGTRGYWEAGLSVYSKGKVPIFLKATSIGLGAGVWIKL